jgi:catechol 2,3-dioxygenase-like lactoylglutathione lyase family enzyme
MWWTAASGDPIMLRRFNHIALRCNNAGETTDFYTKALNLPFSHAIVNDIVPSVQEYCPHIHIFFELDDGSAIAFFEVPTAPPAVPDTNTPGWVKHVSFDVSDHESLMEGKVRLEAHGIDVLGPVDHGFAHSIYFFDPNGHRLEMTHWLENEQSDRERYRADAYPMLARWELRRKAGFERAAER